MLLVPPMSGGDAARGAASAYLITAAVADADHNRAALIWRDLRPDAMADVMAALALHTAIAGEAYHKVIPCTASPCPQMHPALVTVLCERAQVTLKALLLDPAAVFELPGCDHCREEIAAGLANTICEAWYRSGMASWAIAAMCRDRAEEESHAAAAQRM